MRLIDANELKQWLNGYLESDNLSPTYVRSLIDSRPTIDVIPIDWLLDKLLEYDLLETHHTICCLWERWKEENEKQDS